MDKHWKRWDRNIAIKHEQRYYASQPLFNYQIQLHDFVFIPKMLVMSFRVSTGDKWHKIETETVECSKINKLHNLWEFYFRHILLSSELRHRGIEHFKLERRDCFFLFLHPQCHFQACACRLCDDFHLSEIHATKLTASSQRRQIGKKMFLQFDTYPNSTAIECHNKTVISSNIFSLFIMFMYRMFGYS